MARKRPITRGQTKGHVRNSKKISKKDNVHIQIPAAHVKWSMKTASVNTIRTLTNFECKSTDFLKMTRLAERRSIWKLQSSMRRIILNHGLCYHRVQIMMLLHLLHRDIDLTMNLGLSVQDIRIVQMSQPTYWPTVSRWWLWSITESCI